MDPVTYWFEVKNENILRFCFLIFFFDKFYLHFESKPLTYEFLAPSNS